MYDILDIVRQKQIILLIYALDVNLGESSVSVQTVLTVLKWRTELKCVEPLVNYQFRNYGGKKH